MPSSYYLPISDELLSAFIDDAVSTEEKLIVEAALATDPEVVWRLEMLRHTVDLVRDLPLIPLPRSFALSESQVAVPIGEFVAKPTQAIFPDQPLPAQPANRVARLASVLRFQWLRFWLNGNSFLRNAATASLLLFLVLLLGDLTSGSTMGQSSSFEIPQELARAEASVLERATDATIATTLLPSAQGQAIAVDNSAVLALPTVTPSPQPVSAEVAADQPSALKSAPMIVALAEPADAAPSLLSTVDSMADFANEPVPVTRPQLSQLAAGLLTFILLVLWWYSRPVRVHPRRQSPIHR